MASSAFAKAMEKKKNGAKLLQKAREAENNSFELPEIPDDKYIVRVKATVGVTPNKNVPFVEFKWTIVDGDFYGKGYRETFYLENEDLERLEKTFDRLGRTLKVLLGDEDLAFEDFAQLEELVKQVDKTTPHARIQVKNWTGKNNNKGITAYFNDLVEVVDDDNQDGDTDTDTDDSDSGDNDSDSDNEEIVSKGMSVIYDGEEYKVSTSSPRTKTCTLVSVDDASVKVKDVAWTDVEVLS